MWLTQLEQNGICNTCGIETGDKYYIFCSVTCRDVWIILREEKRMDNIDKELYIKWFEEKTLTIEQMKTREEIQARIEVLATTEFYVKQEWALLHRHYDKITGRKGIPPWLKEERDKLITDPHVKVNWDGEPRVKKEKKPKLDIFQDMFGQDLGSAMREMKAKEKDINKAEKEKPLSFMEAMNQVASPKPVESKLTEEEKQKKFEELMERIRQAKEGKE